MKTKKKIIFIFGILLLLAYGVGVFLHKYRGSTDIKKYGQWSTKDLGSKLEIFPKDITEYIDTEYYYQYIPGLIDCKCQIYFKGTLQKENFEKEVDRIRNISNSYNEEKHNIQYMDNEFVYPAYVSIYNFDSTYEYVLIDEVHMTIYYIYFRFVDNNQIKWDKSILPKENANEKTEFNMYAYPLKDMQGWYIDTTSKE